MSRLANLRLVARVARAEGLRATWERAFDRRLERRRRRSFRLVRESEWISAAAPTAVLNLMPTPPAARLGGVQVQFARRIEAEARLRPVTLLYPEAGGWRLEAWGARAPVALALAPSGLEQAVRRATALARARVVHVENVAGLPLDALVRLAEGGPPAIVSVHDFTPFCRRPLLVELPAGRSCGGCLDLERCASCLRVDALGEAGTQRVWRGLGTRLLAAARALVFPSEFLRERLQAWLALPASLTTAVIAPASRARGAPAPPDVDRRRPERIAFVGPVRDDKGAAVFADVVARLRGSGLRFSAFGGGDVASLQRLRAAGVRVHGYYRGGSLAQRLAREGAGVALLLSVGAETYGLTLDECLAARVPVIVFDAGAPAGRVRAWNAGRVLPLAAGVEGVAAALRDGPLPRPAPVALPTAEDAARAQVELYEALGLGA